MAISLILLAGCKTAPKDSSEIETILQSVAYDTTVPVTQVSYPAPNTASTEPIDTTTRFSDRVSSVHETVAGGLRATAGVVLFGAFKLVESALGFDDDDDDDSTPRGKADQNLNQWLDDRDRWRRGD
ncbi:hypothetical protein [Rhodopirellula sp. SWK7]|uniref:hypothetical protein n=1 Tax=Rhodopirellula sp. SWK7 TaxID=595460 RepID=UPI001F40F8CC|nr:hypothetical protein [Rhodopirellula sp. SWK7]